MRIVHDLTSLKPDRPSVLTIGKFDGVHLGHQHLIRQMQARAEELDAQSGVLILHPHPREVLHPSERVLYLTPIEERVSLLAALGVDLIIVLEFTRELAATSAEDFVKTLVRHVRIVELWVGPDFALGRGRQGDVPFLRRLGRDLGFEVQPVEPLQVGGRVVASSEIRARLAEGRVGEVKELLGRWPGLVGTVVTGAQRGHKLGFPTANLAVGEQRVVPGNGVYAVWAHVRGERLPGVANIGVRPSFDNGEHTVEVHIFDFNDQIYGEEVEVEFVQRLREERRFERVDDLVAQIRRDAAQAREVLAGSPRPRYEPADHTADLAIRVYGGDLPQLFANAAYALFDLMTELPPSASRERRVSLESSDLEGLLVDWLNELIYLHETEGETYTDFQIEELSPSGLRARIHGAPTVRKTKAIKAATYHDLSIRNTPAGFEAHIVFDV